MIKMIADRAFDYAGQKLKPKDKFECEDREAPGLEAIGFAHRPRSSSTGYSTRALRAVDGRAA